MAAEPLRVEAGACFHCGEPIPPGVALRARIGDENQDVCCRGCQAVAELIAGAGLDRFYQFRDGVSARPEVSPEARWLAWDADALSDQVSSWLDEERRELMVSVENIHCAACAWLIEKLLSPMPGVEQVQVNAATATLRVVWRPHQQPLSGLFARLAGAGYLPQPQSEGDELRQRERRAALKRLGIAGIGMMQVMMYAVALYAGAFQGIDPDIARFLRYVSLAVATPVVLYSGAPFFRGAWRDLRRLRPGMDVPVALAIGAAYLASVYNTIAGGGEVYFDSATMFVFFLSVARYLEMHARHRSQSVADGVAGALPDICERITAAGSVHVLPSQLQVGDRVRASSGDAIPADGIVVQGAGSVNEALLTGESLPLARSVGEPLRAGSSVAEGEMILEVQAIGAQTLLAQVGRLLQRARSERAPLAALADRVAGWFVLGVLMIAAGVAVAWLQIDASRAFEVVLATLVVTCPCALSLATPAALAAATTGLARCGVLVISGRALESLGRTTLMVLDKTGTLTEAQPRLIKTVAIGSQPVEQYTAIAAALEAGSRHPLARAFEGISEPEAAQDLEQHPGCGIAGQLAGQRWRIGKPEWVSGDLHSPAPDRSATDAAEDATTWLALADEQGIQAWFAVATPLRPQAPATIAALHQMNIDTRIASGDAAQAVASVARAVGIEQSAARLSAEQKLSQLRSLQDQGEHVAMVGDGVNDAPVLGGADVAIAMGSAAALARSGADLVLLGRSLAPLAWALRQARRCGRIVRQNLGWAVCYNLVAVPLAASGLIAPWMAAAGMSLSSLIVVGNAIRLQKVAQQPGRLA